MIFAEGIQIIAGIVTMIFGIVIIRYINKIEEEMRETIIEERKKQVYKKW